jgi:hypothetical protein
MSASTTAVLGFVAWAIVLSFVLVGIRLTAIAGGKPLNSFDPAGRDVSPFGYRVTRAHGNAIENLAINLGPLLVALATGHAAVTDPLAMTALGARVLQSAVHIASTSPPAVLLRATFFSAQLLIALYWIWALAHAA